MKPPSRDDRSKSRSKSNRRGEDSNDEEAMDKSTRRAFRTPAADNGLQIKSPIDGDQQAKVHTIKYKNGGRNPSKQEKKHHATAKEDERLFERKKKANIGRTLANKARKHVSDSDDESEVEEQQPRRNQNSISRRDKDER